MASRDADTYFQKRAVEHEEALSKRVLSVAEKELSKAYQDSLKAIQTEIDALYGKFAKDNGVSISGAKSLLKGDEYKDWRLSLDEYVKAFKETGNPAIMRELNTLSMRTRINRLDELRSKTLMEINKLGITAEGKTTDALKKTISETYTAHNHMHGQKGFAVPIVGVSNQATNRILGANWSGKHYSERIWNNTEKLAKELKKTISDGMHRGVAHEKLARDLAKRMDVGLSQAKRIVRTEMNYAANSAALESIKDCGFKFYKFVATLDSKTSALCRECDGKIFEVKDGTFGVDIPPLHPNCRSVIVGSVFGENVSSRKSERIARDSDGKNVYIPADMMYTDYKDVIVDKKKSLDTWKEENKAVYDKFLKANSVSKAVATNSALLVEDVALEQAMNFSNKKEANEFLDDWLGISLSESDLEKINKDVYSDVVRQLVRLDDRYGAISDSISSINVVTRQNYIAAVGTDAQTRKFCDIRLNKKYFNVNKNKFSELVKNMVDRGHCMPIDEKNFGVYTITHEYGHMLHNMMIRRNGLVSVTGFAESHIKGNIYKIVKEQAAIEGISMEVCAQKYLSRYAMTDFYEGAFEAFAELFTHITLSNNPNPLGKRFIAWINEELGG